MTGWQDLTLTVDGRPMAATAKSALVGLSLSRENVDLELLFLPEEGAEEVHVLGVILVIDEANELPQHTVSANQIEMRSMV